ncbi:MAG: PQQ-binding-like beta-propeller repeat protein [Cyclobacteriaceae bacterium]|nr:PQQ-binding-like beta-propeller repeat protein [Cyclobacteriaceae bacterium]
MKVKMKELIYSQPRYASKIVGLNELSGEKNLMEGSVNNINSWSAILGRSFTITLFLLAMFGFQGFSQGAPDWVLEAGFTPQYVSFSNNDKYIILENEGGYEVWGLESRKRILHGKYKNKLGRSVLSMNVSEGSAFMLYEKEDVFLQFDYTLNQAQVAAFDLGTGDKIWQKDNLDAGVSTVESIFQLFSNAQRVIQDDELVAGIAFTGATGINTVPRRSNILQLSYVGHDERLKKIITYLPEKEAIAVNGKNALHLLALKTGEILWEQPDLNGGLGEVFYEPLNDIIVAIRVSQSDLENIVSRPEVQALDAKTGNLIWSLQYSGDFIPGTAYVLDDVLLLPYYGLTLINVKTGEELEGDVQEGMKRSRRMYRNMSVMGAGKDEDNRLGDNCSYPFVDENDVIHYVVGMQGGKHIDPDGSRKSYLQIDFHTGKIILQEDKIAKQGNRIIQEEMTDNYLYLKMTEGLSSSIIMAIDRKTGKVAFETEKVSNRLGTDFDPFLLDGDKIVDASSKGIYTYDAKTGKELSVMDYKAIDVGRLRNQFIFEQGLILFGTKGIAITDHSGNLKASFNDIEKITDFRLGENEIWLVEKNRFIRIDAQSVEVLEEVRFSNNENVFFSANGSCLVRMGSSGKQLDLYFL